MFEKIYNGYTALRTENLSHKNSYCYGYAESLYQESKKANTPFFRVESHNIKIIQDPLQFFLALKKGAESATFRIGLTCLYLGTGTLERYLLRVIKKRKQLITSLDIDMVFDYNRSLREENGESSAEMLSDWKNSLPKNASQANIGLNRNSQFKGILGEINGVHHQKIAIFDNTVIIGGANMSRTYFLNRKDRYMQFSESEEMANYFIEYLKVLRENSYQLHADGRAVQGSNNLERHMKLWNMSYRPKKFYETLHEQEEYLNEVESELRFEMGREMPTVDKSKRQKSTEVVTKNEQIAQEIGTSIMERQEVNQEEFRERFQAVRESLFSASKEEFLGNQLQLIEKVKNRDDEIIERGKTVYVFPFMHYPKVGLKQESQVFQRVVEIANRYKHDIRISSGYLNLTDKAIKHLSKSNYDQKEAKNKPPNSVEILCSSPEANSFFEGGRFKKYIPYFYRCFEMDILKHYNQYSKFQIKEFNNNEWSFHTKGVWIKESENSYLTVLGSSNYNYRSENSDIELQLYMYSSCPAFNKRLDKEYAGIKEHCKNVTLSMLESDKDIKITSLIRFFSKVFKKVL